MATVKIALIFGIVIILCVHGTLSIIFSRCDLARTLLNNGFPRHDLGNWVCLVESESSRNTGVVGGPNSDGSYDYGLFQINNHWWCKNGYRGGGCSMDCNQFLDDDIHDDAKCAKHIFSIQSWQAWFGWIKKCKNQPLPDLSPCGL